MQDPTPLNDPRLEALAGRLAATPPRLEPADRDALVYQCGFAAGRQSAMRGVRRWSVAAACLAILAGGVGLMSWARHETRDRRHVATVPEAAPPVGSAHPATSARARYSGPRQPGMLLARASWEQVRASLESPPDRGEGVAVPDTQPRRRILRVGSVLSDLERSQ